MMLALAFLLVAGASAAPNAAIRARPDNITKNPYSAMLTANSGRIVSGWEANDGDYPYAIALRMTDINGFVSSCTGSIIHNEWGITAGHCTTVRITIMVRAGSISHLTPEIIFETQDYYHPSDFVQGVALQNDDVSLIKFNRFVEYSNAIQPVRLQPSAQKDANYGDVIMRVAGWGLNASSFRGGEYPEILNWVYVLGMSNERCRADLFNTYLVADSTVCTMAYNVSSQSPCDGDSGAPLIIDDVDGKPTVVGLASFSSGFGCEAYSPSGYIRPGHYHDWFFEVTGINFDWDPASIAIKKEEESSSGLDVDVGKVQIVESADA